MAEDAPDLVTSTACPNLMAYFTYQAGPKFAVRTMALSTERKGLAPVAAQHVALEPCLITVEWQLSHDYDGELAS